MLGFPFFKAHDNGEVAAYCVCVQLFLYCISFFARPPVSRHQSFLSSICLSTWPFLLLLVYLSIDSCPLSLYLSFCLPLLCLSFYSFNRGGDALLIDKFNPAQHATKLTSELRPPMLLRTASLEHRIGWLAGLQLGMQGGRTPKGSYSPRGCSGHLLETLISEPPLRTLLRTPLLLKKTHSKPPF